MVLCFVFFVISLYYNFLSKYCIKLFCETVLCVKRERAKVHSRVLFFRGEAFAHLKNTADGIIESAAKCV